MRKLTSPIDPFIVRYHAEQAVVTYDQRAVIERTIADRLLKRLDIMRLQPSVILDLGARTGYTTQQLKQRYASAQIYGVDYSLGLLSCFEKTLQGRAVVSDYKMLPLSDASVDLVFSNLALHWSNNMGQMLNECYRVLRPGGCLLLTSLGPDTLKELRASFMDEKPHVHMFFDMHDIGDYLLHVGFLDPVMDVEEWTVYYSSVTALCHELKLTGTSNALLNRHRGLTGKQTWKTVLTNYESFRNMKENVLPATIETMFAHACVRDSASCDLESKKVEAEAVVMVDQVGRVRSSV